MISIYYKSYFDGKIGVILIVWQKFFEKKFAKNLQIKIFGVPLHSQSKRL